MNTLDLTPAVPRPWKTRVLAHPLVRAVLAVLAVFIPMMVTLALSEVVPKPWRTAWPLLLAAAALVAGYRLYVRKLEKRELTELALPGARPELLRGLGIGTLLVVATTAILMAAGAYAVTGTAHWTALLKPIPEQVMVAFMEEILFRAIVFRLLEKSWGTTVALTVSMLIFVAAHLPNEHISVLGAVITAIAAAALVGGYLLHRRLWLPIGMHFAWNYLYAGVFAVPVSGHPAKGWLQVAASGPEWLSGGGYGPEASVVTLLTWGIAAIALLRLARRQGQWLPKP